jgi:hypothetical protein
LTTDPTVRATRELTIMDADRKLGDGAAKLDDMSNTVEEIKSL